MSGICWKFQSISNLKAIFESLQDFGVDAVLTFLPGGVHVDTVDEDCVALVRIRLKKDGFLHYECPQKQMFQITPTAVLKVINLADSKDNVTLRVKTLDGLFLELVYTQPPVGKAKVGGGRECVYQVPICEPSTEKEKQFFGFDFGAQCNEASVSCQVWEEQLVDVGTLSALVTLTMSKGALHFESDENAKHVLHRILYSPLAFTTEGQNDGDARKLAREKAVAQEHLVMNNLWEAIHKEFPEFPDNKDDEVCPKKAMEAYWERNIDKYNEKVKNKVRDDILRERRAAGRKLAVEQKKLAVEQKQEDGDQKKRDAEALGFTDVKIDEEPDKKRPKVDEEVKETTDVPTEGADVPTEGATKTQEEGATKDEVKVDDVKADDAKETETNEEQIDYKSPEIQMRLDKVAEKEFRKIIFATAEGKLAEHFHTKDTIRHKHAGPGMELLAGSASDGQTHMSLRITKFVDNVVGVFSGTKLKQMASRALAFGKHFKLLMQQDQPLIMKMDLSATDLVGTIEFCMAPRTDDPK